MFVFPKNCNINVSCIIIFEFIYQLELYLEFLPLLHVNKLSKKMPYILLTPLRKRGLWV